MRYLLSVQNVRHLVCSCMQSKLVSLEPITCVTFQCFINARDAHGDLACTVTVVKWNRQLEVSTAWLRVDQTQTNWRLQTHAHTHTVIHLQWGWYCLPYCVCVCVCVSVCQHDNSWTVRDIISSSHNFQGIILWSKRLLRVVWEVRKCNIFVKHFWHQHTI